MEKRSCCGGSTATQKGKAGICAVPGTAHIAGKDTALGKARTCCQNKEDSANSPSDVHAAESQKESFITDWVNTSAGQIPRISTHLAFRDVWGSWKCRWSIGRMDYRVKPGLYCIGIPDEHSPVLVTANYKMTFDRVRVELSGVDAWILVLDTDGVNVWCAAGKGTFGTEELVRRIAAVRLGKVVVHRTVVVPQLGATGITAYEVQSLSGFKVVFGPVRASDIKAFLSNGLVATETMRTVQFPLRDRIVLTPMELVGSIKPLVIALGVLFILNATSVWHFGWPDLIALLGSVISGSVITPALLPWIPGKAFSFKGFLIGTLWALAIAAWFGLSPTPVFSWIEVLAYFLILPTLSAFIAMNFTGSSTFTSLSGVDKEMKFALPAMVVAAGIGTVLLLVGNAMAKLLH